MRKTTAIKTIKVGACGGICIPTKVLKEMRMKGKSKIANIDSLFKVNVQRCDDCIKVSFDDRLKGGTTVNFLKTDCCQFYAGSIGRPGDTLQLDVTDNGELFIKA